MFMSHNRAVTRAAKAALLLCASIGVSSCTGHLDPNAVAGEYAYQYKTGEVEVIQINRDKTFVHEFYNTRVDYTNRTPPAFKASGTYSIDHRQWKAKGWRMFYDMLHAGNRLPNPYEAGELDFTWYPPDKKVAAALVYTEDGYYFRRTKDRQAIIE